MFVKKVNELDEDFIIIWSKYMLTKDQEELMPYLTALAELGQVQATQKWYVMAHGIKNSKIEANYRILGEGAEQCFVRASHYRHNHSKEVGNLIASYKRAKSKYEQSGSSEAKLECARAYKQLKDNEWYENMQRGMIWLVKRHLESRQILYAERYFEILESVECLKEDALIKYDLEECEITNKMRLKFNRDNDTATKFAYAKNLIRNHAPAHNSYDSARVLLQDLSKRKLSIKLTSYMQRNIQPNM